MGLDPPAADLVTPPSVDRQAAVKLVMAAPLFAPGVNETRSEPAARRTTVIPVGGAGDPTTTGNAAAGTPEPRALMPSTVQTYLLAVVIPVTCTGLAAAVALRVTPPSLDVHDALNPVMALPFVVPAMNDTTTEPVAAEVVLEKARTNVGAPGDPGMIVFDVTDATLLPEALVALTVHR